MRNQGRRPLVDLIREELAARGLSARAAAMSAGLPVRSVQGVLEGHSPSLERAEEICEALGIEFYIGPPREPAAQGTAESTRQDVISAPMLRELETSVQALVRVVVGAGGNPYPDDIQSGGGSQPMIIEYSDDHTGKGQVADWSDYDSGPFFDSVRLAAGAGNQVLDEQPTMRVGIRRDALWHPVQRGALVFCRASGDSMEPTVHDADLIAIDLMTRDPIDGEIFALRVADEVVVVKRLSRRPGAWTMTSDNSRYRARPVGAADRIIGRVVWSGPLRD